MVAITTRMVVGLVPVVVMPVVAMTVAVAVAVAVAVVVAPEAVRVRSTGLALPWK